MFNSHSHILPIMEPYLEKRVYNAEQNIYLHGDNALNIWFVLHGWVKLLRQTPDGKETILRLCTTNDVFGEEALSAHVTYNMTAISLVQNTEIVYISVNKLKGLAHEHPEICSEIMGVLNEHIHQNELDREHLQTLNASQRLGCFIIRLLELAPKKSNSLEFPIGKNTLASYLGMKPETFSRSQSMLRNYGVTIMGTKINITNVNKLLQYVCSSCSEKGFCSNEKNCFHSSSCNMR